MILYPLVHFNRVIEHVYYFRTEIPKGSITETPGREIARWAEPFGRFVLIPSPNHAEGVYGIHNLLRHGIATKSRMDSSRREYTLVRDAMRFAIPCTLARDSMPSLRLG